MTIKITPDDACPFTIGQRVTFTLDDEMHGLVTGIIFTPMGCAFRITRQDLETSEHVACELRAAKEETV